MKPYRVRFWSQDGNGQEEFMGFDTMEQAQSLYESLDGLAEIQQYSEERHEYEALVYPEFEY
jgi:hypothetical protein|nr:hypothetical protein [uncultured Acetatifactor sp.]